MRHPEEVGDSNCSPTSMSVSNSDMQDLPVIVISASRDGRKIAEQAGASAYIAKPFDYQELIDSVDACLSGDITNMNT